MGRAGMNAHGQLRADCPFQLADEGCALFLLARGVPIEVHADFAHGNVGRVRGQLTAGSKQLGFQLVQSLPDTALGHLRGMQSYHRMANVGIVATHPQDVGQGGYVRVGQQYGFDAAKARPFNDFRFIIAEVFCIYMGMGVNHRGLAFTISF